MNAEGSVQENGASWRTYEDERAAMVPLSRQALEATEEREQAGRTIPRSKVSRAPNE